LGHGGEGGIGERILFGLFLLLLVWVPIPLGSNFGLAWAALEIAAFCLTGAWFTLWATGRASVEDPLRRAWPAFALLGVWVLLQALHIVPMPRGWVEVLSPEAARVQALTDVLGTPREEYTLSIEPHASRMSLLKTLAYVAILFLALALVNSRARVLVLARVLVYSAVVHSVIAVLLHLADARLEFMGAVIDHGSSASGFYRNRNHFAGYLEMMLAVGIGLLLTGLSNERAETWKHFLKMTIEWILSPKMFLRLSLCILVIALTTTHSRMGNTGFFASLLIAGIIGIALSRYATRNTVLLLSSLVVIDLLIVGSWFGVEKLAERLEKTTVAEVQDREEPAAYTLKIMEDYPVFGTGPGTFYIAFPRYRPATVTSFYDYAHNDYIQFACESGVLGLGLLGLVVVLALGAALRAQWQRRDPLMRGMAFACVMGVTAILIHSTVDFNLHIPANAVYFMVLLALGWISLHLDRRQT
jgi:O-antigen ligase